MEGGLQDWELLNNSDSDWRVNSPKLANLEETEGGTRDLLRSDHFSLDNQSRYVESETVVTEGDLSEESSVVSENDNPNWIDPGSETRLGRNNSGESWSGSGNGRYDASNFDANKDLGFADSEKGSVASKETGELEDNSKNGLIDAKEESYFTENAKNEVGLEDFGEIQVKDKDVSKLWSDSGVSCLVSLRFGDVENDRGIGFSEHANMVAESDDLGGNGSQVKSDGEGNEGAGIEEKKLCVKVEGEEENGRVEWWKVPFQILKYCVFKVSPVWSFSVAAAVMGFVFLGHRLYRMKRRPRSLQLKVTIDDKKVSQFMSHAARLNEAFSAVRRVPIARPSLQTAVINPWPVMSLR